MDRASSVILAAMLLIGVLAPIAPVAEEKVSFWAVTGVRSDDVLHLRDVPSAESRSLADIPANARGLKHLGCRRNQPALEQWMRMTQVQRQEALMEWCRVEFRGKQGWVAARYLKKDLDPSR
jgi:predicted Fe-S protein YdhL (DUF1289 family)